MIPAGQIFHPKKGEGLEKIHQAKPQKILVVFGFFNLMLMSVMLNATTDGLRKAPGVRCSFDLAHLPQRSQRLAS